MAAPAPGLISVFSSPQELGAALAQLVAQRAACCLAGARARFALGLSGGSLVSMLARELPAAVAPAGLASLARWTLGFCDERLVPFDHAESTYGLYRMHLLSRLPIPESQVITINPELPVEEAAEDYAKKLRQRILEDQEENPLPAALVQPHTGKLCWFLDEAAARLLTVPFEKHSTL
ncbi:PGLS isoform 3 [Pongo abelii]|uniref:PGLS isoform 3 n=1 Tax=Pongo abelii TaxID=9601 RepID=A0A2J8T6D7_PONAB|nr:PGLS isoform 3 [Pongo abelii]